MEPKASGILTAERRPSEPKASARREAAVGVVAAPALPASPSAAERIPAPRLPLATSGARRVDDRMLHAQRLQTLGRLASGVVQEVARPMGRILSTLVSLQGLVEEIKDSVQAGLGDQPTGRRAVEGLVRIQALLEAITEEGGGAGRIQWITDNFREISQGRDSDSDHADVNACIEDVLGLCGTELKGRIQVERRFSPLPAVSCSPSRLGQVVLNLILNAIQSVEAYGRIVLTTRLDRGHVVISVRDDGCGIPEAHMSRLFEPHFTTKPADQGSGLGLHAASAILEAAGGRLTVFSRVGEGTDVIVRIPVAKGEVARKVEVGHEFGSSR